MRGCDVVLHAASADHLHSLDLRGFVRQAVAEMRGVLRAAADAELARLVYTSTLTTVGRPGDPDRLADERDFFMRAVPPAPISRASGPWRPKRGGPRPRVCRCDCQSSGRVSGHGTPSRPPVRS